MLRRLVTFASAISLLLCVAIFTLWIRSHWFRDVADVSTRGVTPIGNLGIYATSYTTSMDGTLTVNCVLQWWPDNDNVRYFALNNPCSEPRHSLTSTRRADFTQIMPSYDLFDWHWDSQYSQFRQLQVAISHWLLGLISAAMPASWLLMRRYRPNHSCAGYCKTCDYNLTGNISGICPECGSRTSSHDPPNLAIAAN